MEMKAAQMSQDHKAVEVKWKDGRTLYYPYIWLRDNCQCGECFHPGARCRILLFQKLDPQIQPKSVEIEDNHLRVTWPDGHHSIYTASWLLKRGFVTESPPSDIPPLDKKPVKYWGSELQGKVPVEQFDEMMANDRALYRWITALEELGICLIKGAALKRGQLAALAGRVSQLFYTYYGTTFQVEVKTNPSNPAYTGATLGLHSDLASLDYLPGMQMLHCIAQTSAPGGDNTFADSHGVAKRMQKDYPDMYKLLTTVPLYNSDIGTDLRDGEEHKFFIASKHPCVLLDVNGEIDRVYWSGHLRESIQNHIPLQLVTPLYTAMCKFEELMRHPDHAITLKTQPGDIICFHNYRVLHGRTSFVMLEGEHRHLEGGYISWDDLHSRRRVIEQQLNEQEK